jgi:predicted transcriptional regulator
MGVRLKPSTKTAIIKLARALGLPMSAVIEQAIEKYSAENN